jgi:secreted PhoX family phosphatase
VAGTRREFIGAGVGAAAVVGLGLGAAFWAELFGSAGSASRSPRSGYGPRGPANELGLRLPEGFRSRLIARGREPVAGTNYGWHEASDGMACFATDDGGWILVSNSEVLDGGASAVRFGADGQLRSAYRILDGTTQNCSGGPTPWGTWLSCEEVMGGLVWECDPAGRRRGLARPAMGTFKHEAAAVDPRGRQIYLTEDLMDGGVYRFTPTAWHDLSAGLLEIATVAPGGAVSWSEVPDPAARRVPTRQQVRGSTQFKRAEGIWHDDGTVYISTTGDHRVHAYEIARGRIDVIYDGLASAEAPLLRVDQLTANRAREVFVCEDIATEEIDIGLIDRAGRVSRFLSATGPQHAGSELTGVTFDPSGSRMYFSSQRAFGRGSAPGPGAIYEVSGPFRGSRAFHAAGKTT